MTRNKLALSAALLLSVSVVRHAKGSSFNFNLTGPGVSGTVELTYGPATDAKYPQAFEVTGISGTFSDSNNGLNIVNAAIGSLEPLTHSAPDPTNLLAPDDFSKFAVASGLPSMSNGVISYDNLFYPLGSPQTASDYPLHGGFLDIYGLVFNVGGGTVVNIWSNGDLTGTGAGPIDYGVAVATSATALDYVSTGVSVSPEPAGLALIGSGLIGMALWRFCAARRRA